MQNYLVRVITKEANVLGLACVTTGLVNNACRLHGTHATASAALGRALTGGGLMASLLKNDQRLALKFEGNGPLKKIIVEADSDGFVRGFVGVPEIDLPLKKGKLDVAGAVGPAGFLTVIKDVGLKEPYEGIVQLRTSEIAEDLAYYFAESEQIPSAVGLGVYVEPGGDVSAAGGFIIQSLPPADEEIIDTLVKHMGTLPPLSEFFREGGTPERLLEIIFHGITYDTLEKKEFVYRCTCGGDRIKRVIRSLGTQEIGSIIEEQGEVDVTCEFCRTTYHFGRRELVDIMEEMRDVDLKDRYSG